MNAELTFQPSETPGSRSGITVLRLSAYVDAIIVGQAICKYKKNPQDRFDQTATLSILSSIYGAIKGRIEKVFEEGTALRQADLYPEESKQAIGAREKIPGIGISIIRELVSILKSENMAFLEIEIAKGGGEDLTKYYQKIGESLIESGVILSWSHYRDGIRFKISDSVIPFI